MTAPEDEREALARLLLPYMIDEPDLDASSDAADAILAAGYSRGDSAAMREALRLARDRLVAYDPEDDDLLRLIDAVLALPASEPVAAPVVTEEMVERAVDAYDSVMDEMHSTFKGPMRVALEAALKP